MFRARSLPRPDGHSQEQGPKSLLGGWHLGRGNVSSPAYLNQKKLQPLITNTPTMTNWGSLILGGVFLALNPKLSTQNLKIASIIF